MNNTKEEIRHKEILKFLKEKGDYSNQAQHIPLFAIVRHIEDWDDQANKALSDELEKVKHECDQRRVLNNETNETCHAMQSEIDKVNALYDIQVEKTVDLRTELKEWKDLVGEYRAEVWSGQHTSINDLQSELSASEERVKTLDIELKALEPHFKMRGEIIDDLNLKLKQLRADKDELVEGINLMSAMYVDDDSLLPKGFKRLLNKYKK